MVKELEQGERKMKKYNEADMEPSSPNFKEYFKEYFFTFYGKGGLYPIDGLTESEMKKAISLRKEIRPNLEFVGDSTDREMVRDIVLATRNGEDVKKVNPFKI